MHSIKAVASVCISPIFVNNQGSEEYKTRKVVYDFNNSTMTNVTLVQSNLVNVHEKSSATNNLFRTTAGFKGQLVSINFGGGSKTRKSEEKFGNAKCFKAH